MSNYQSQRFRNQPPPHNQRRNMNRPYQNAPIRPQQSHPPSQPHHSSHRNSPPPTTATSFGNAPPESPSVHSTHDQSQKVASNPNRPSAPQQDIRNMPASEVRQNNKCYQCGDSGHYARECPLNADKKCFNCGEGGHYSRDCTSQRTQQDHWGAPDRNFAPRSDIQCYNCSETGHISRNCPLKQQQSNSNYGGGYDRNNNNNNNNNYGRSDRTDYSTKARGGIGTRSTATAAANATDATNINDIFKRERYDVEINTNDIVWLHGELCIVKHKHNTNGKCNAFTIRKLGKSSAYDSVVDIDEVSLKPPQSIDSANTLKALWNEVRDIKQNTQLLDGSVVKVSGKGFGSIVRKTLDGVYVVRLTKGDRIEASKKEMTRVNEWEMKWDEMHHTYEPRNDNEMDVYDFLEEVSDVYMWRFMDHGVNSLKYLLTLSVDDLKEIGMALGHRKYFARKIQQFDKEKWSVQKEERQQERDRLEKERLVQLEAQKAQKKAQRREREKKEEKSMNVIDERKPIAVTGKGRMKAPQTPESPLSAEVETGYEDDEEENDTGYGGDREDKAELTETIEAEIKEEQQVAAVTDDKEVNAAPQKIVYVTYCDPMDEGMVLCACVLGFALKEFVHTQHQRALLLPRTCAFNAEGALLDIYSVFGEIFDEIRAVEMDDNYDIKTFMKMNAFKCIEGYSKVAWIDPFSMIADRNLDQYVEELGAGSTTQVYSPMEPIKYEPTTEVMIITNILNGEEVFERFKSISAAVNLKTFDVILGDRFEWDEIDVESNKNDEFWCVLEADDEESDSFVIAQFKTNPWDADKNEKARMALWIDLAQKVIAQFGNVEKIVNPEIVKKVSRTKDEPKANGIKSNAQEAVVDVD